MKISVKAMLLVSGLAAGWGLVSCKGRTFNANSDARNLPAQAWGKPDPRWIYNGPLPKLERVRLTVSQATHTVRVTGVLPAGYEKSRLPHYVKWEDVNDPTRPLTRVNIVYPIATGDLTAILDDEFNPDGTPKKVRDADPGVKPDLHVIPYRPQEVKIKDGKKRYTEWGGFPYMEYDHNRGIAFHGPITPTSSATEWELLRGGVSHGCNRMQGEHAVELAHLVGVDMLKVWEPDKWYDKALNVKVTVIAPTDKDGNPQFDIIQEAGKFKGMAVDVNYKTYGDKVKRPTENVLMFESWDARDFPRFVCEYQKDRPLDMNHCGYKEFSSRAIAAQRPTHEACNLPDGNSAPAYNGKKQAVYTIKKGDLVLPLSGKLGELQEALFLTSPKGVAYVDSKYVCPCKTERCGQ